MTAARPGPPGRGTRRARQLLATGEATVLLGGDGRTDWH